MGETKEDGRLLAIGDIHGCRDQLIALLAKVKPQASDRLIFLGDYIDRGPHSKEVIDLVLALRQRCPHCVFLKGNHEAMFLDYLVRGETLTFLRNGGDATLASYAAAGCEGIPQAHRDFLNDLQLHYETDHFIFVHAGMRPGIPLEGQREQDLLWIREEFLSSNYDWGKTVVFGHTPRTSPQLTPNRISLDTGAVYGGRLTCCEVQTGQLWQA